MVLVYKCIHTQYCGNVYFALDSTFFPGRCAEVRVGEKVIGRLGVLHPDVITAFDLTLPVSAVEIDIEQFL